MLMLAGIFECLDWLSAAGSLYERTCSAIAEAHAVDEVKDILDKARAIEMYARQAQNTEGGAAGARDPAAGRAQVRADAGQWRRASETRQAGKNVGRADIVRPQNQP